MPQQDKLWKSSRWIQYDLIQYQSKKCRSQQSEIKPVKSVNTTYRANTSSWILLNSVKLCPLWIPMETTSPRSPVLRFHLGTSGFDVFSWWVLMKSQVVHLPPLDLEEPASRINCGLSTVININLTPDADAHAVSKAIFDTTPLSDMTRCPVIGRTRWERPIQVPFGWSWME